MSLEKEYFDAPIIDPNDYNEIGYSDYDIEYIEDVKDDYIYVYTVWQNKTDNNLFYFTAGCEHIVYYFELDTGFLECEKTEYVIDYIKENYKQIKSVYRIPNALYNKIMSKYFD